MSWEDQGRQGHGWFGSGTTGAVETGRVLEPAEIGAVVAAGAGALIDGGSRGTFRAYLDSGGLGALSQAVPVWADAASMPLPLFREQMVGPEVGLDAAAELRDAGRLVAGAGDVSDLRLASERLGSFVSAAGPEWRYKLGYALDQAAYAAAHKGAVGGSVGSALGGAVVSVGVPVVAGGEAGGVASGVAGVARALAVLGPWGRAAAAALTVGVGAYLYFHDDENAGSVVEARPPDERDGGGAGPRAEPSVEQPGAAAGAPGPEEESRGAALRRRRRKIRDEADRSLPNGMTRAEFGRLAGFEQGQADSAAASVEAPESVIVRLKNAGVTRRSVELMRDLYKLDQEITPSNTSAQQRLPYLNSIIRRY